MIWIIEKQYEVDGLQIEIRREFRRNPDRLITARKHGHVVSWRRVDDFTWRGHNLGAYILPGFEANAKDIADRVDITQDSADGATQTSTEQTSN